MTTTLLWVAGAGAWGSIGVLVWLAAIRVLNEGGKPSSDDPPVLLVAVAWPLVALLIALAGISWANDRLTDFLTDGSSSTGERKP